MTTKTEPREYKAMISDEGGVVRGRIPSPLVREMGARPGDYMVFRTDGKGTVTVFVARSRTSAKKRVSKAKGAPRKPKKSAKKR